jgi:16S rRNA (uracil1498-N3)-methyltransferase
MPAERYYLNTPLRSGQMLPIQEREHHHLVHVMRSRVDGTIEIVNGQGQLAEATIVMLGKREATVLVHKVHEEPKPAQELILVQAIPRANRLDFIIEKGVELGVTQLWLLPSKLSERKQFTTEQMTRIEAQMVAAMKQCGRLFLPSVQLVSSLSAMEKLPYPAYFGDLEEKAPPFSRVWRKSEGVLFFTGPESGFTQDEVEELRRLGVQGVKLHPYILRTETASIAALSLLSHWLAYD